MWKLSGGARGPGGAGTLVCGTDTVCGFEALNFRQCWGAWGAWRTTGIPECKLLRSVMKWALGSARAAAGCKSVSLVNLCYFFQVIFVKAL